MKFFSCLNATSTTIYYSLVGAAPSLWLLLLPLADLWPALSLLFDARSYVIN